MGNAETRAGRSEPYTKDSCNGKTTKGSRYKDSRTPLSLFDLEVSAVAITNEGKKENFWKGRNKIIIIYRCCDCLPRKLKGKAIGNSKLGAGKNIYIYISLSNSFHENKH